MSENGDNDDDNGNGKVQFRRKDGVEKDGYICFPVEEVGEKAKEEDRVEEKLKEDKFEKMTLTTCPDDPRYQQTNKTGWCSRMYVDYHRCRLLLGEGSSSCDYFYRCSRAICPNDWLDRWDQQLAEGRFPVDIAQPSKRPPC